jgi:uncharacterized protein (TIGR03435 family)
MHLGVKIDNATVRSNFHAVKMETYASLLASVVDRPVVDQTELKGEYMLPLDFVIRATMMRIRARREQQAPAVSGQAPSDAASEPDSATFAGVQAMGLKLEARKLPMPLLVIDHLEKSPTEN